MEPEEAAAPIASDAAAEPDTAEAEVTPAMEPEEAPAPVASDAVAEPDTAEAEVAAAVVAESEPAGEPTGTEKSGATGD